jgi:thiosulfate/3-mercaptopyruvate sulfurtransferase
MRAERLVDFRAPVRFRGEEEPVDWVAGHVLGAVNLPYTHNLSESGCFKPTRAVRRTYVSILAGVSPAETGPGVIACHTPLAMEAAGFEGGRVVCRFLERVDPRPFKAGRTHVTA